MSAAPKCGVLAAKTAYGSRRCQAVNKHGYQCVKSADHFGLCVPTSSAQPYAVWRAGDPE